MRKKSQTFPIVLLALFLLFSTHIKAQQSSIKLKVVSEQANIRLKPDIGSIIIQQVPKETVLVSNEKKGEWYQIRLEPEQKDYTFGYVHESLVREIRSALPEKEIKKEKKVEPEKTEEKPSPQIPSLAPAPLESKGFPLNFSLTGGINYFSGGDFSTGSQGLAVFYEDFLGIPGKGSVNPVKSSYVLGGSLNLRLSSNLFIGVGFDYLQREKESSVEFQDELLTGTLIIRPKIQAFPLRVALSYYPVSYFYIKSGIEFYFVRYVYFYRFQQEEFWQEWLGKAREQGFGILGGLGVEWPLFSSVSFVAEAIGRYSRIKGFRGKNNYKESTGSTSVEEGKLYIYDRKTAEQKSYSLLFIQEKKPSGLGIANPREATINLSGISLRAGIKVKF
ncbi:SH3 domain-containing protein [Acidobacteriota bacterium]